MGTRSHICQKGFVRRLHTLYISYFLEHNGDDEPYDSIRSGSNPGHGAVSGAPLDFLPCLPPSNACSSEIASSSVDTKMAAVRTKPTTVISDIKPWGTGG